MEPLENIDKIIEKIKKLLALSKSSNEAEASLAAEKVHELLLKYNISMSQISSIQKQSTITTHDYGKTSTRLKPWRSLLINKIAKTNYCGVIVLMDPSRGYHRFRIIGFDHNIRMVTVLTDYLFNAVETISRKECPKQAKQKYRENYRLGLVVGICNTLDTIYDRENNDAQCRAIVVQSANAIKEHIDQMGGVITESIDDPENSKAYEKGIQRGQNISLSRQLGGRVLN